MANVPLSASSVPLPRAESDLHAARRSSPGRQLWLATSSAAAAVMGVAPHVLHHSGPLAGAALLGGVSGSLLFGALGFLLAIPLLVKLRRRFGGWHVSAAAVAVFAVVFSISTLVIGPAIAGGEDGNGSTQSQETRDATPAQPPSAHEVHH